MNLPNSEFVLLQIGHGRRATGRNVVEIPEWKFPRAEVLESTKQIMKCQKPHIIYINQCYYSAQTLYLF